MKTKTWAFVPLSLSLLLGFLALGAVTQAPWGTFDGFAIVKLIVDGREVVGDVPAVNIKGRTLIPLRLVAEQLGAQVEWDQASFTASVSAAARGAPNIPDYSSWTLTEAEAADAIAWAKAGKPFEQDEILPMYVAHVNDQVTLKFLTPWAIATALAHKELKEEQVLTHTPSELSSSVSGTARVVVLVYSGSSLPNMDSVNVTQGNATYSPDFAFDPIQRDWAYGQYAAVQEFVFDASPLSKSGTLTVRVTISGSDYVYSWELSSLK